LLSVAGAPVELAEADVTVGHEWAHTERLGQSDCFPVARLGHRRRHRSTSVPDLAEKRERECLHAALAPYLRDGECLLGKLYRIVRPVYEKVNLTQMGGQRTPAASNVAAQPRVGLASATWLVLPAPNARLRVLIATPSGAVLRRPLESTQYLSIRYTERLAAAGIERSVGSAGDSSDNALAESVIGLYKTEVIRRRGPWRGVDDVELATLTWVAWYNAHRLLEPLGYVPPAGFEQAFYAHQRDAEPQAVLT
jgi:transposase InsO family protein